MCSGSRVRNCIFSSTFSLRIMPTRLSLKNAISSPHKKNSTASKINDVSIQRFEPDGPVIPPLRVHHEIYHRPTLLLDSKTSLALLSWFDSISEVRSMPWRMKWIDPESFNGTQEEFQDALTTRAYEVWVSEISKSSLPRIHCVARIPLSIHSKFAYLLSPFSASTDPCVRCHSVLQELDCKMADC